jgi:hypothetical protein
MTFIITLNQSMSATFEVDGADSLEEAIKMIYKMEVPPKEASAKFGDSEWFQNLDDEQVKIPQEIVERAGVPWDENLKEIP